MVASNSECIFVKWHDIFQQQWIFAALLIFFQHNLGWLGSRVWDVIQNRYKNHLLGAIVCDFWGWRLIFWSYVIMQDICNIFIEINFCFGCMVWLWLRLFQHWTFVKYWWDEISDGNHFLYESHFYKTICTSHHFFSSLFSKKWMSAFDFLPVKEICLVE